MVINRRKFNRTELNFWVMPNAGFATRSLLQPFITEFEKAHPEVQIRLTIHPWSLAWNQIMDVLKGRYMGPLPDVIQVGTTWVATLAYLGALEKIPASGVLSDEDQMSATIWDPGTQSDAGESLYCLPWFIDLRVLYYRKDVLRAIQMSPDDLHNWEGFHHACLEIQRYLNRGVASARKMVAPLAHPGQKLAVLMHDLAPWIWEAGGDFCSPDFLQSQLNSPASIKGVEFYFDLIKNNFMPIPNSALPHGNFFTGHYAMQFTGSWPVDTFLNPNCSFANSEVVENYGVAPVPSGPVGRYTFLGGSNLAVTSVCEKKDLAWEFTRFLSGPERQVQHARTIGALTARLSSMEKLFETAPTVKKIFWDSIGHARRLPRIIALGSVEQIISKMNSGLLSSLRSNKYSPRLLADEMNRASHDIDKVLSLHRYGEVAEKGKAA